MNKWSELFLGLILIIGSIIVAFYSQTWGMFDFWTAAGEFLKGGLFWFVVMIGTLFVLLGISDLNESMKPKPRTHSPQAASPASVAPKKRK